MNTQDWLYFSLAWNIAFFFIVYKHITSVKEQNEMHFKEYLKMYQMTSNRLGQIKKKLGIEENPKTK